MSSGERPSPAAAVVPILGGEIGSGGGVSVAVVSVPGGGLWSGDETAAAALPLSLLTGPGTWSVLGCGLEGVCFREQYDL